MKFSTLENGEFDVLLGNSLYNFRGSITENLPLKSSLALGIQFSLSSEKSIHQKSKHYVTLGFRILHCCNHRSNIWVRWNSSGSSIHREDFVLHFYRFISADRDFRSTDIWKVTEKRKNKRQSQLTGLPFFNAPAGETLFRSRSLFPRYCSPLC